MNVIDIVKACRPKQWYKNLVIFIAIFFKGTIFEPSAFITVVAGFFSLCLISSTNYIINDIIDRKKDLINPEKKSRPIAAGKISPLFAVLLAIILFFGSLIIATKLGTYFLMSIITLFVITSIYSIYLKNKIFLDIIIIGILFVIRAISGVFILEIAISPWLIVGTFFLSLFLSVGKRISESTLNKEMYMHRDTLKFYSKDFSKSLITISSTILIVCFALYSFLANHNNIIYTLPIFVYLIFRYLSLIYSNSDIPRHPETIYKDKPLFIGLIIMVALTAIFIYL